MKLKALHSPIIVHFSPDVKSTSLNPLATRETVDSGIYKIFYGITRD
jgi:hypothetical protein